MGKGSTQFQHLVQTEVPPSLLQEWLAQWAKHYELPAPRVELRPHRAGSTLLELGIIDGKGGKLANVVFASIQDRNERKILSIRDQNTFDTSLRRKRLMTLMHLFLIHRYKIESVHYLTPTEDNQRQTEKMTALGIYTSASLEVGELIVADVNRDRIAKLLEPDRVALGKLIDKSL